MHNQAKDEVIDGRCHCSRCQDRTKETYEVPMRCTNCGWRGKAIFRKGDRAGSKNCPHCGCDTATREWA